jgi:hypothetical protein
MDEWFAAGPELGERLRSSAQRLADTSSLRDQPTTRVDTVQSATVPDPMAHFAEHWLAAEGYFPDIDPETVERTIREGFTAAVAAAAGATVPLPLQTVWVSSPDPRDLRVDHVVGPTAVTVVIVTPVPVGL